MTNILKHLKKLSKVKSNAGIKFLSDAVSPGNHCPMRIASVIANDVEGLSSLLIGMPECTTHSRLFSPHPEGKQGELHWLYVLDANEVVFGCHKGLVEALKEMDRAGAKHILMIATCIPELIGEDLEGVIHEVQPQIKAKLTHVMLGQFKNVSYPPGSWKTMESFYRFMEKQSSKSQWINVLGRGPEEDHQPMPSLLIKLEAAGIKIRYLAPKSKIQDFEAATDARLNIVVSPYMEPLAQRMALEYGIPYEDLHNIYETSAIEESYQRIFEGLAIKWDGWHQAEKEKALIQEEKIKSKWRHLTFVMGLRVDLPLALSYYLMQLGMEPLLIHLEEYYPQDSYMAQQIGDAGSDPYICRMVNEEVDLKIIEALAPDICFGYIGRKASLLNNIGDLYDFYGLVGYERTLGLLQHIEKHLDQFVFKEKGEQENGIISI